jgi:uncharacterized protein with HEPN domain
MRREDAIRLRHMLEAAEEAARFATGRSRSDLDSDRMLVFALVRAIEIVGEAANSLSEQTRRAHRDLPWQAMIGMRNRVIHAYFDVDLDRIWDTVTEDLPPLAARLRDMLASSQPDEEK